MCRAFGDSGGVRLTSLGGSAEVSYALQQSFLLCFKPKKALVGLTLTSSGSSSLIAWRRRRSWQARQRQGVRGQPWFRSSLADIGGSLYDASHARLTTGASLSLTVPAACWLAMNACKLPSSAERGTRSRGDPVGQKAEGAGRLRKGGVLKTCDQYAVLTFDVRDLPRCHVLDVLVEGCTAGTTTERERGSGFVRGLRTRPPAGCSSGNYR